MTDQKRLKQRIRERMARTGERYAIARKHVLAARGEPGEAEAPLSSVAPPDAELVRGRLVTDGPSRDGWVLLRRVGPGAAIALQVGGRGRSGHSWSVPEGAVRVDEDGSFAVPRTTAAPVELFGGAFGHETGSALVGEGEVLLRLAPCSVARLEVTVRDAEGRATEGSVRLRLARSGWIGSADVTLDGAGQARLEVVAGDYELAASRAGDRRTGPPVALPVPGGATARATLALPAASDAPPARTSPRSDGRGGDVRVRLVDAGTGRPAAGRVFVLARGGADGRWTVEERVAGAALERVAYDRERGEAWLRDVPAGRVQLAAWGGRGRQREARVEEPSYARCAPVEVEVRGGEVTEAVLALPPAPHLRLRALLPDGRPAAGAGVEVRRRGAKWQGVTDVRRVADDGRLVVDGVGQGEVVDVVVAELPGHHPVVFEVTSAPDEVALRLSPGGPTVRVKDDAGRPLALAQVHLPREASLERVGGRTDAEGLLRFHGETLRAGAVVVARVVGGRERSMTLERPLGADELLDLTL